MRKSQTLSTLAKITSYTIVMKTLWNTSILALIQLKCALEILLHNQFLFSPPRLYQARCNELVATTRHASTGSPEQCSVCLSEVGDGEEVGELRCSHVFHALCLQRWVQCSKRTCCPLCRGSLAPVGGFGSPGDQGVDVLFFKFCCFSDSEARDDNDSWWLR